MTAAEAALHEKQQKAMKVENDRIAAVWSKINSLPLDDPER